MSEIESKALVERLRSGDSTAAVMLFDLYVARLVTFVRQNHQAQFTRRFDPEDVVQSVLGSFFVRLRKGEYDLGESGALWRLLVAMAANKIREAKRFHSAHRRSVAAEENADSSESIWNVPVGRMLAEPSVDDEAMLMETLNSVMARISPAKRQIVQLHLRGFKNGEIAEKSGCTVRLVQRTLKQIHDDLVQELDILAPGELARDRATTG